MACFGRHSVGYILGALSTTNMCYYYTRWSSDIGMISTYLITSYGRHVQMLGYYHINCLKVNYDMIPGCFMVNKACNAFC